MCCQEWHILQGYMNGDHPNRWEEAGMAVLKWETLNSSILRIIMRDSRKIF